MASLAILLLLLTVFWDGPSSAAALSTDELVELIRDLKGQDDRLMRWDATEHTAERQPTACQKLPEAAAMLVQEKDATDNDAADPRRRLACEYATWCITDNPYDRAKFSDQPGVHEAVVKILANGSPATSAAAGHLIYIAVFANEKNHQGFFRAGAVEALADVIISGSQKKTLAVQLMWGMAALQNLFASYCATRHDGRCYWDWPDQKNRLEMQADSLPVISDGRAMRRAALQISRLVPVLQEHVCRGPVAAGDADVVMVGENAVAGRDDDDPAIVPWAAAGALKNLALEEEAAGLLDGPSMVCYCNLKESPDWLEEAKAYDLLTFLRPHDPCWNQDQGSGVCIDGIFLDEEGYYCDGYGEASEEECSAKDIFTGQPATKLCCGCGGGERFQEVHEEL